MIRSATTGDAVGVCAIYNHYIENAIATFEEQAVELDDMRDRIAVASEEKPWFVYEVDGAIAGYAYASAWQSRCAYRFSLETTVYLSHEHLGRGIGTELYSHLIDAVRKNGIHSLLAAIAMPNPASVALHENLGFEKVGQFREVGWKFDQWIDVGYWELIFKSQ